MKYFPVWCLVFKRVLLNGFNGLRLAIGVWFSDGCFVNGFNGLRLAIGVWFSNGCFFNGMRLAMGVRINA